MTTQLSAAARTASSPFSQWLRTAKPGSLFLDQNNTLYLMTPYHHRVIKDQEIANTLIERERYLVQRTLSSQRVIRGLFGYSAVITVMCAVMFVVLW